MVPAAGGGREVNVELLFRGAAVGLALVLALAPYRRKVAAAAYRAMEAAKAHSSTVGRIAAVVLLLVAAWGKIPVPSLSFPVVPSVSVSEPSAEMKQLVAPIASAMASFGPVDRALWAQTWSKAAVVVRGDAVSKEVLFTDTRALRLFTSLAVDIAWRRIGQHAPGSQESLRTAVEAAYGEVVGTTVAPVTADLRDRYAAFAEALAWAGMNRG